MAALLPPLSCLIRSVTGVQHSTSVVLVGAVPVVFGNLVDCTMKCSISYRRDGVVV